MTDAPKVTPISDADLKYLDHVFRQGTTRAEILKQEYLALRERLRLVEEENTALRTRLDSWKDAYRDACKSLGRLTWNGGDACNMTSRAAINPEKP